MHTCTKECEHVEILLSSCAHMQCHSITKPPSSQPVTEKKRITCKGQNFIVTLQKTQGEKKKKEIQNKNKFIEMKKSLKTIHHTRTTV